MDDGNTAHKGDLDDAQPPAVEGKDVVDLVIIGGGPAGMSAALVAGRARLRTVVINAESPRNAVTRASHGFLTRDGVHPLELLEAAKEQMAKYGSVHYVVGEVCAVERCEAGLAVTSSDGHRWTSRRVLIAAGFRDHLSRLALPGIDAVYGRSVFPCPFCDGFEHADERLAVFGGAESEHFVPVVRVWSDDVVVFSNGAPIGAETVEALRARGVPVEQGRVARLLSRGGRLTAVELEDGRRIERDAAFISTDYAEPSVGFADDLGVPRTQNMWGLDVPEVDASGKTSVDGLYVIGDSKSGFGGLIGAANDGSVCASGIVHEVAAERWAEAARSG